MCDRPVTVNYNVDGTVPLNSKCDKCKKRFHIG